MQRVELVDERRRWIAREVGCGQTTAISDSARPHADTNTCLQTSSVTL